MAILATFILPRSMASCMNLFSGVFSETVRIFVFVVYVTSPRHGKIKGDLLKQQWDFEAALVCYTERHELILSGACKNAHIYLIAESYQTLIAANKAMGDIFKANELVAELNEFKNKYSHVFNGSVAFYS